MMEPTPQHTAARLDLDERAVLMRPHGTFLPRKLGRAQWNLERAGLLGAGGSRPTRVVHTATSRAIRDILAGDFADESEGWGIMLVGRGEPSWWRPNGKGYTLDVSQAGLYSRERADEQHGWSRGGLGNAHDVAVPPARMRELLDAALAKARDGVARLEQARAAVSAGASP